MGQDVGDERCRAERIHDRRRIVGRDQQVEIADRIAHPSERACVVHLQHAGECSQLSQHLLREVEGHSELDPTTGFSVLADCTEQVVLRLRTETLQVLEPVLV